jgi:hypothetical protein
MEAPKSLFIIVCDEWTGTRYARSNLGIYSTMDTANQAREYLQANYKISDIEYWVDEVEFCEVWK